MKIVCPNCNTGYQVPDDYIGEDGRSVRCAKCGETWHAEQVLPEAPEVAAEPEEAAAASEEQSQDDIDAMFAGADGDEEQSQDDIDALFDTPGGDEEQSQDDIDALFDTPGGDEEQSQDDIDALFDTPGGDEEQSQDDIDALFDTPGGDEEQNQDDIDALFDSPGGEEQSQDDVDALFDTPASPAADDALPDFDADDDIGQKGENGSDAFVIKGGEVAEGYRAPVLDLMDADTFEKHKAKALGKDDVDTRTQRRRRRILGFKRSRSKRSAADIATSSSNANGKREWAIGGVAALAAVGIVITLFSAPTTLVSEFPDLASLYRMAGIDVNVAGVNFDLVDVQMTQKNGSPMIAIEAELVNPGLDPVILPSVQFSILGNEGAELYSWAIGPDHVGLGPGERKLIETSVAAPSQAKSISLRVFH